MSKSEKKVAEYWGTDIILRGHDDVDLDEVADSYKEDIRVMHPDNLGEEDLMEKDGSLINLPDDLMIIFTANKKYVAYAIKEDGLELIADYSNAESDEERLEHAVSILDFLQSAFYKLKVGEYEKYKKNNK